MIGIICRLGKNQKKHLCPPDGLNDLARIIFPPFHVAGGDPALEPGILENLRRGLGDCPIDGGMTHKHQCGGGILTHGTCINQSASSRLDSLLKVELHEFILAVADGCKVQCCKPREKLKDREAADRNGNRNLTGEGPE
jgi:hypothetical protein